MKRMIIILALGSILTISLNAGWIDTGIQCKDINGVDIGGMIFDHKPSFPGRCGAIGKLYSDKWRCKSSRIQIKCK